MIVTKEMKSAIYQAGQLLHLDKMQDLKKEEIRKTGVSNDEAILKSCQLFPQLWEQVAYLWNMAPVVPQTLAGVSNTVGPEAVTFPASGPTSKSTTLPLPSIVQQHEAQKQGQAVGIKLYSPDAFVRYLTGKKTTAKATIQWIFDNIGSADAAPANAPNPGAWFYLEWLRGNPGRVADFYTNVYTKTIGTKGDMDEEDRKLDGSRKVDETLTALEIMLERGVPVHV